ncbi:ABC transporter permease [Thermocrispum municipale]|jgi:NitT/TauT family transport system permease protein|uniref:ABC transporter permease n=1 Tax=Thermocrispum municipale TaxID=37926 RepID=UPI00048B216B|nr:ABC transporter permease [Thermocrispum municipale]
MSVEKVVAPVEVDEAQVAPARAKKRRRRWAMPLGRLAIVVVLLVLWELSAGVVVDEFFVSRPSKIWEKWAEWAADGTLWYNASSTFASAGVGFAIGGALALLVGYVLGGSRRLGDLIEPFITSIYSLPKLALVPLFVMWFGIGRPLQVAICALVVFFLMFYNTFYGIRDVDRSLIDAMRVMGGSRWDIAVRVRLPSALVWVVAGLKLSVPQALVAVVVAEILASNRGLGHLVALNSGQFNASGTFAALFTLLIIGITVDRLVAVITRRALLWKQDGVETQ